MNAKVENRISGFPIRGENRMKSKAEIGAGAPTGAASTATDQRVIQNSGASAGHSAPSGAGESGKPAGGDSGALPSREMARELAADERVNATDLGSIPSNAPQHVRDAVMADAAWAADKAAILYAYASGALVPAGAVEGMRERAAAICDDEVGEKPSPYYETSRAQEALEVAAARIRALPLEVPRE